MLLSKKFVRIRCGYRRLKAGLSKPPLWHKVVRMMLAAIIFPTCVIYTAYLIGMLICFSYSRLRPPHYKANYGEKRLVAIEGTENDFSPAISCKPSAPARLSMSTTHDLIVSDERIYLSA